MLEYYRDLAEQLAAMPGGHVGLREEYFGTVTLPDAIHGLSPACGEIIEGWMLKGEGELALVSSGNGEAALMWLRKGGEEIIATFPPDFQQAIREFAVTPMGLALLVLAMGGVDDAHLRKCLPEVHKASKGLLLIAVCRLCG